MTISLTLQGVSYALPDGRALFTDLNDTFDRRPTGLVGRNGVGKTLLARILAGQLAPSAGRCLRSGKVHYLAQQVTLPEQATVGDLAGVQPTLEALARIESGSTAAEDFDTVADRWDIHQRLTHALSLNQLGHLQASTPARALSGGEAMRVALVGAMMSDADFLILDEPSNHLDLASTEALEALLRSYQGALLVVSHDDAFLERLDLTEQLVASPDGWCFGQ